MTYFENLQVGYFRLEKGGVNISMYSQPSRLQVFFWGLLGFKYIQNDED